MEVVTVALSFLHRSDVFQVQLIVLLASLILSLILNRSLPYFAVSAFWFLTSLASLAFALGYGAIADFACVQVTTTSTFTLLLLATCLYAGFRRSSPAALRWHAATTLACSVFLAMKAFGILQDTARPVEANIDQCSLLATGFAAMHLLSALLMLHECTSATMITKQLNNEKLADIV